MCRHVTPHTSYSFSSFPKHHCHFLLQKTSCPYNAICLGGTLTPSKKFHHIFFSPRKDCQSGHMEIQYTLTEYFKTNWRRELDIFLRCACVIVNFVFRVIYSKVIIVYYNTPSISKVVDFFHKFNHSSYSKYYSSIIYFVCHMLYYCGYIF